IAQLRHGLSLDGRALKPAGVFRKGEDRLRFILEEGRNRQIRRMCEQVGLRVVDLFRTRIGPLSLDGLPEGRWRYLSPSERQALLTAASSQERL
ncbi:MAG: rRNA pseudouridine synthase, partial [Phenylobacterium sp.]|nr:rRNA pseudouridine synthase [Phenylobacterium sp.]